MSSIVISVDAMGGDDAPGVVLEGVAEALAADTDLEVVLVGPEDVVEDFCRTHDRCEPCVATEVIGMGEHPANAVRIKKDSSIVVGCRLVKEGRADGFFSAGSTGACLAAAVRVIGRIKGVRRPALTTIIPSPEKPVVMADVGANADCKPEYLVQFAQMAVIYARRIIHIADPRVALLNIGSEPTKGSQFYQETHELLRAQVPEFVGNGEGNDIIPGVYDVFVCDGFTGNVALKTIEGTSKQLFKSLKGVMTANPLNALAAAVLKGSLRGFASRLSADTYGGAPLLGVRGAVIVGHGSSSPLAIKNGILTTAACVREDVCGLIEKAVQA